MRHLLIATAMTGAMLFAAGCETTQTTTRADRPAMTDEAAIDTPTATLVVHGMGCPLCANNVDKQLLSVRGVRDVKVDMGSGRVTVHLDESNPPTKAQLARAVDESGFTLVSISTP